MEGGDWNEVKSKKKFVPKEIEQKQAGASYGGMTKGGKLVAGPVASKCTKYGGPTPAASHQ